MDECARCRTPAPDQESDEFTEWEAIGDGTAVVCPGCITLGEERAMYEDMVLTGLEADELPDAQDRRGPEAADSA